jgi:hypothetical protein
MRKRKNKREFPLFVVQDLTLFWTAAPGLDKMASIAQTFSVTFPYETVRSLETTNGNAPLTAYLQHLVKLRPENSSTFEIFVRGPDGPEQFRLVSLEEKTRLIARAVAVARQKKMVFSLGIPGIIRGTNIDLFGRFILIVNRIARYAVRKYPVTVEFGLNHKKQSVATVSFGIPEKLTTRPTGDTWDEAGEKINKQLDVGAVDVFLLDQPNGVVGYKKVLFDGQVKDSDSHGYGIEYVWKP